MRISANKLGSVLEHELCIALARKGYEVFKNISCVGPIDAVAYNSETDEWLLLEIRSNRSHRYINHSKTNFGSLKLKIAYMEGGEVKTTNPVTMNTSQDKVDFDSVYAEDEQIKEIPMEVLE